MKTNHSPLPWKLGARSNDSATIRVSNTNLGIGDMYRVEDAAFIVKACNAHDELCKLLLRLVTLYEHDQGRETPTTKEARAILAKVQS